MDTNRNFEIEKRIEIIKKMDIDRGRCTYSCMSYESHTDNDSKLRLEEINYMYKHPGLYGKPPFDYILKQ